MAAEWFHGLLVAFFLHHSACLCEKQGGHEPVITRITEPVAHSEGPHWHADQRALYFVDIAGQTLHRYDPNTCTENTLKFDKPVTLVVPMKGQKHKFVVTLGLDLVVLTWDWESGFHETSVVVSVDKDQPKNRFNDGKADDRGRMWAGTMGFEEPVGVVQLNKSTFYRVDNNPSIPCHADPEISPVSISNGLAWTRDNKVLYYIDTPTRKIDAFDFDLEKGTIASRRTAFDFGEEVPGNPDGMTIDSNDHLWIACWGGSMVIQVNPSTGELMRKIEIPVERVTSVVFGGEKLDTLYVTTMRAGLNETQLKQQPSAGAVFEITGLGVTGTLSKEAVVNCKCN